MSKRSRRFTAGFYVAGADPKKSNADSCYLGGSADPSSSKLISSFLAIGLAIFLGFSSSLDSSEDDVAFLFLGFFVSLSPEGLDAGLSFLETSLLEELSEEFWPIGLYPTAGYAPHLGLLPDP